MTKSEIMEMLEQYDEYEDITVISYHGEKSDSFKLISTEQVENYDHAERMIDTYVNKVERTLKDTHFKSEENRQNTLNKLYNKIDKCYDIMNKNEY